MNEEKCPHCGGYLPQQPMSFFRRPQGVLYIWVCPNCRQRVQKWVPL